MHMLTQSTSTLISIVLFTAIAALPTLNDAKFSETSEHRREMDLDLDDDSFINNVDDSFL